MSRPSDLQRTVYFLSARVPVGDQHSACLILLKSRCAKPCWTGIGLTSHELRIQKPHIRKGRQKPLNAIVEGLKLKS